MRRWRKAKEVQASALAVEEPIESPGTLVVSISFDGYSRPVAEALVDSLPKFIGRSNGWSSLETRLKQKATMHGEVIDFADPPIEIQMEAPAGVDTSAAEQIAWAEVKRLRRGFSLEDD